MGTIEKRIVDFFGAKKEVLALIFFSILGIVIRLCFKNYETSDFIGFLQIWFNELKEFGGLKGMAYYSGNYNYVYVTILAILTYFPVPALYSIKIVSVIFDYLLAIVAGMIAMKAYSSDKKTFTIVYAIVLLCPTVMINSALWAQCDSIYCTFVLLAILLLLYDKYPLSFLMLGVAVAFKIQAVFILPFFVLVYFVNKKFSILHFLLIPAGSLIMSIPGMIFSGRGIAGFIHTYVDQMGDSDNLLTKNFPNIYYWISANHYDLFRKVGILFTIAVLTIVFYIVYCRKESLNQNQMVSLALWTVLCCVYFLPNMHERYGYVAEILCIIWAAGHTRWAWYPILMDTIILFCYFIVHFGYYLYLLQNMGAVNIIAFVLFSIYILREICVVREETS